MKGHVLSDLLLADFTFELPPERIAQHPLPERDAARLLILTPGAPLRDGSVREDLSMLLRPGDLLVLNDTKVIPARVFGWKPSGGRVEMLVTELTPAGEALAQARSSKPLKEGGRIETPLGGWHVAEVLGGGRYRFRGDAPVTYEALDRIGRVPLPPYIRGGEEGEGDRERYQTVFARAPGAVAAPTAGLHLTEALLAQLKGQGVHTATVTLHVGLGTFAPIRVENLKEHKMHSERFEIPEATARAIEETRSRGGRVVAVGTTVVRTLESRADGNGGVIPGAGQTDIFITPGHRFGVVDAMLTNFHLPGSTLMLLVAAFAGTEVILAAYRHAIAQEYRFYSYGDAMWLERGEG